MRRVLPFNHDWLYIQQQVDTDVPDSKFEEIRLPHSNKIFSWHNFDDEDYQFISTYRKRFTLPQARAGRRIYLDFEGVMTAATVTLNGHTFEEHRGGFVPFSYDITDYLNEGGENLLQVSVDSRERHDIPPHGGQVDYLVFGGIYREVSLRYVESVHIENVKIDTEIQYVTKSNHESDQWLVGVDTIIKNDSNADKTFEIQIHIVDGEEGDLLSGESLKTSDPITVPANSILSKKYYKCLDTPLALWSVDTPILHKVIVELADADVMFDRIETRFGWRQAEFKEDGFYLNGEKVFLRGLNRHQMYPFIGMAAPQRLQVRDADIIKYELGCNIVRTAHYPQSKHFLNRCDEIGLLVFEEIPGWQHIGDEDWQHVSLRDVQAMIERDWNHPSIVIWGVRINESWDHNGFYEKTNRLARELDPTRPTTGVRFWPHSEFLEDVYSYNDFTNGVLEPTESPWLITEMMGHMFPTKTYDNEERQVEHMRRHAKIQAQAISMGGVSGAIGWCAFDYNTHLDFGSGDRVCYHGVMDMYRQPKFAAYLYRSQKSPDDEIVLQVASFWTMGDRAGGGNDPLYILTNCDCVEVFVGGMSHGSFKPAHEEFPNLPHPPVKVTGLGLHWGGAFDKLRVAGYWKGKQVAEQIISADSVPKQLICYAEDDNLHADGRDMTRLVFKVVDAYGNRLPFSSCVVRFEVLEGDAELIGDNPFALVGGQAALFIKAGKTKGCVRIKASTPNLEPVEAQIQLT